MIEISIEKKMKRYDGSDLFRVQARFQRGSTTLVTGPSGSGKTTLLRLLAGLVMPDKGWINGFGQTWTDTARNVNLRPQRRSIGFVFQDFALFPHYNVLQHLEFGTRDAVYIRELVEMTGLAAFLHHRPGMLSGGQRQRLGIARALSTKPRILLMDEPFSALDSAMKRELQSALKSLLVAQGTTCILVSHQVMEGELWATDYLEIT